MARGLSDWTIGSPSEVIHVSQDTAELAARLGSLNVEDRKGNVLWYDDFSCGVAGVYDYNPDTYRYLYCSIDTINQNKPCLVRYINYTGTYGSWLSKYFHLIKAISFGFETALRVHDNLKLIQFEFMRYSGTRRYQFGIRYDHSENGKLYVNNGGSWVGLIIPGALSDFRNQYHYFKICGDFSTGKYIRFILDDVVYNLSDRSYQSTSDTNKLGFCIQIRVDSKNAGECIIPFTHFLLTINE